jgi:hypothetical protein
MTPAHMVNVRRRFVAPQARTGSLLKKVLGRGWTRELFLHNVSAFLPKEVARMAAPTSEKARALREKAALCRRAAAKRTNGGHLEDRLLFVMAEEFEQQAAALEKL